MKIGLIDVDSHNFPNLALMKISAYHKALGDTVEWANALEHYDVVYQSKVFDNTYSPDIDWSPNADKIIKGGTGYNIKTMLPDEIEHIYPDYNLYPTLTKDTAYGYLTRGCPRGCEFCIAAEKEGRKSCKVANLNEFWRGQKYIKLLDANILACKQHIDLLQQLADSKAHVDFTQGLDARLLTIDNIQLINQIKLKGIHFAWDKPEDEKAIVPKLELYAKLATHKPHGMYGTVYCLTNFGTTHEQDLYRVYKLTKLGYDPYVMIYDKPNAPFETRRLQTWCNNVIVRKQCPDFADFGKTKDTKQLTML